jgi:CBS domain-containing protein
LRPEVLKDFHDPVRARLFSAFWVFGFRVGYAYDGPLLYGDAHTRLTTPTDPKDGLPPMAALDTYLPAVLDAAIGKEITHAPTSSGPDAMRDPARLLPDGNGIVIVPVVDQMEVCRLSSETHRHHESTEISRRYDWDTPQSRGWIPDGGGTYHLPSGQRAGDGYGQVHPVFPFPGQSVAGTHLEQTTTVSVSGGTRETRPIGNVRVRLLLFRVDGGRIVARSTVYAAGAGNGLAAAMAGAGWRMARGVADFLAQSQSAGTPSPGR